MYRKKESVPLYANLASYRLYHQKIDYFVLLHMALSIPREHTVHYQQFNKQLRMATIIHKEIIPCEIHVLAVLQTFCFKKSFTISS